MVIEALLTKNMKQKLSTAILFFTVAYFGIGLLLYISQGSFLYFPTPAVSHNFDSMVIHNEGEAINVILVIGSKFNVNLSRVYW